MITMHICGGMGRNHQLIVYISVKENCPLCNLLNEINSQAPRQEIVSNLDGEVCKDCGTIMTRTGACYTCPGCGSTGSCG